MADAHYSIALAAQKSGLSTHAIRVWEKRYQVVAPGRSHSNRRRYSAAEVERLGLLAAVTQSGHRIGDVARLADEQLRQLVAERKPEEATRAIRPARRPDPIEAALQAVRDFDATALEQVLAKTSVAVGQHGLLQNVIGPLAARIGDLWQDGRLTAAHEHFATSVIRTYLLQSPPAFAENPRTPRMLVVTPTGQLHELGAAIVAAAARDLGWAVTYLGANLPAAEIAGAAVRFNAAVVALSIVYPGDDPALPAEIAALRGLLPATVKIIAGGRAAAAYQGALAAIDATIATELNHLYLFLDRTHRQATPIKA